MGKIVYQVKRFNNKDQKPKNSQAYWQGSLRRKIRPWWGIIPH